VQHLIFRLLDRNIAHYVDIVFLFLITTAYGRYYHYYIRCYDSNIDHFNLINRLNQCVGELNYRYFLLFLFTNASFFVYGAYVCGNVLLSEVSASNITIFYYIH
jgi:hypothetical protein